jgi:hypothetical protein
MRSYFIPSRVFYVFLAFLAFLCLPVTAGFIALAQSPIGDPGGGLDLAGIFGSTAALAGFVITAVQFVRAHVWQTLDGITSIVFTFVLSVVLAIVGFYLHLVPVAAIGEAAAFGASAGVVAIGGVNLLKQISNKTPLKPA